MLGFSLRLGPRVGHDRRRVLPLDAVHLLVLFDTWFDPVQQKGRPIAELPIPEEVAAEGDDAVERYRDERRLAYQLEAPVNWCPALGTVLANEEVQGGVSERGGHPVVRLPLRQWMLRITAYADRLETRPGRARLAREHQAVAAELDRPQHGGGGRFLHRHVLRLRRPAVAARVRGLAGGPPRGRISPRSRTTACCESTPRGPTRSSAPPTWSLPRSIRFVERLTTPEQADAVRAYCETGRPQERPRPHRSGQGKDGRVHRLLRDQSGQRRGDSDLDRRLCAR